MQLHYFWRIDVYVENQLGVTKRNFQIYIEPNGYCLAREEAVVCCSHTETNEANNLFSCGSMSWE